MSLAYCCHCSPFFGIIYAGQLFGFKIVTYGDVKLLSVLKIGDICNSMYPYLERVDIGFFECLCA